MTAPLPIDATTHTIKVVISSLPPSSSSSDKCAAWSKTFDVPLERFSIYRTGYLTSSVVEALDERSTNAHHPITINVWLPSGLTVADVDRIMQLVGLAPLPGPDPTLAEVVRFWPALRMLEARHAVDRCYASLVAAIALDRAQSVLAVYLFDAMCAESSIRHRLGRDNVLAPLMPMDGPDSATPATSSQSIIDYMTLKDRLVDLAMAIRNESSSNSLTSSSSSSPSSSEQDGNVDLSHRTMVAMVVENRSRLQTAVAQALCDWSLPLHAIDQVFATDFTMARPLTDARARWLVTGNSTATTSSPSLSSFEETIAHVCPAFAPALVGKTGILAAGDAIMAGGAVVNAIQRPDQRRCLPGSDIDLWIVGTDHTARADAFRRVVARLFDAAPGSHATIAGSVVTVYAPKTAGPASAPVQVILTPYRSASQVVCNFDMSHACAYYDGHDAHATWACLSAIVTRTTRPLPGMTPKPDRILKARAKGFIPIVTTKTMVATTVTPPTAAPLSNDAAVINAVVTATTAVIAAATATTAKTTSDDTKTTATAQSTETPSYFSWTAVVDAFSYRPLTSDNYMPEPANNNDDFDGDINSIAGKTVGRDGSPRRPLLLSERFAVAMPLMTTITSQPPRRPDAPADSASSSSRSVAFRLVQAADAGSTIARHRDNAMRDYRDAEKNVATAAAAALLAAYPATGATNRSAIEATMPPPGTFGETGFGHVKVHHPSPTPGAAATIVDGITGTPMRLQDIDPARHVFSATLTLAAVQMSPRIPHIHYAKRIQRLRVYPRAFVSTAARVIASASIIAADHFTLLSDNRPAPI
jgi:hypothetical protein